MSLIGRATRSLGRKMARAFAYLTQTSPTSASILQPAPISSAASIEVPQLSQHDQELLMNDPYAQCDMDWSDLDPVKVQQIIGYLPPSIALAHGIPLGSVNHTRPESLTHTQSSSTLTYSTDESLSSSITSNASHSATQSIDCPLDPHSQQHEFFSDRAFSFTVSEPGCFYDEQSDKPITYYERSMSLQNVCKPEQILFLEGRRQSLVYITPAMATYLPPSIETLDSNRRDKQQALREYYEYEWRQQQLRAMWPAFDDSEDDSDSDGDMPFVPPPPRFTSPPRRECKIQWQW